ncbi:MAG: 4-(cytidine 5'-diphospho)-2-C-methyl-D-erythritol kinase [Deltaproteobacteria bacterium]|jgi:4-diphosphocytidyl-2-C-methyl-D-erythritol kinase|nr:MAG: 4-(cytidine 5'-diphospho)-2-C-methyl-D-erythritol kinase [Deltaproteobacteria bacterium]
MLSTLKNEKSNAHVMNQAAIEILSPAKVNLFLKITGQRVDGYHELVSVFVPVALYDKLKISKSEKGLEVYCTGRELPKGQDNLVNKAAISFFEKTGIRKGTKITLIKKIPISSGLGGGSSDAAATLKGLNQLWPNPLSKEDLERLALSLGADVPFFLLQKPAIARGIGEILQPIENFPSFWYVIVSPDLIVSTAWAYERTKLELTNNGNQNIINSLKKGIFNIPDLLFNDLERVTLVKYPFLCSIKDSLIKLGALGALMTGSGPSIFGLFDSAKKAQEAGKILESYNKGHVFVVKGLS